MPARQFSIFPPKADPPLADNYLFGPSISERGQFSIGQKAFSLVELMVVVSIIAVLTLGALPSFNEFSRYQTLIQSFRNLTSDLRLTQSKSLNSVEGRAWGVHFAPAPAAGYQFFNCAPVATTLEYSQYRLSGSRCAVLNPPRVVNLGNNLSVTLLNPSDGQGLDIVFDAQNGVTVANGNLPAADVSVTLGLVDGAVSPQTVRITQGGGIID